MHHFPELTIADWIRHVPAQTRQDHLSPKMAAFVSIIVRYPTEVVTADPTLRISATQKISTEPHDLAKVFLIRGVVCSYEAVRN